MIEIRRRSTGGQNVHGVLESHVDGVENGLQVGFTGISVGNAIEENAGIRLVPCGSSRAGIRIVEDHILGVVLDVILLRQRDPIIRPRCLIHAHERAAEDGPQRRERFVDKLACLAEGAHIANIGRQAEPRLTHILHVGG